jgi:hypothetical protein
MSVTNTAAVLAELKKEVDASSGGASALSGLSDVSISSPTTNQVLKYNGTVWVNGTDSTGGGGSGATVGTATLDFGATPAVEASVTVTGEAGVLLTSAVDAFIQGATTVDNSATDHRFAGVSLRLLADDLVAGDGFTIYATATAGFAAGAFEIRWRCQ